MNKREDIYSDDEWGYVDEEGNLLLSSNVSSRRKVVFARWFVPPHAVAVFYDGLQRRRVALDSSLVDAIASIGEADWEGGRIAMSVEAGCEVPAESIALAGVLASAESGRIAAGKSVEVSVGGESFIVVFTHRADPPGWIVSWEGK